MASKLCSLVGVSIVVVVCIASMSVQGAVPWRPDVIKWFRREKGVETVEPNGGVIKTKVNLDPHKYNVIYVIDSSSSISDVNYRLSFKVIERLTQKARHDTKYAAVMFSTYAQVLSTFTSPENILQILNSTHRMRGGTNLYEALRTCSELFQDPSSGVNPKALNRILIITDGLSNLKRSKTITEALELKFNQTEIFVVAIGRYVYGMTEISVIASSQESHVFKIENVKPGIIDVTQWIPHNLNGDRKQEKSSP